MPTPRFALTDTIDNTVVDAVLAALEVHDHSGGDRLRDPSGAPSALLNTADGTLPGSSTYVYRYGLVDRYGFETTGSVEVTQSTPVVLSAPDMPLATSDAGGLLDPGIYYVYLNFIAGAEQTSLSPASTVSLIDGEGTIVVVAPTVIPTGTTGIGVWRQGPGEVAPTHVGSMATGALSFTDTGTVAADNTAYDPTKLPPSFNRTNSSNSITISLSAVDAALLAQDNSPVLRWRLYRSTTSGGFTATSLLHQVVETDDAGHLLTSWTDDGTGSLTAGTPLEQSRTLKPSVAIKRGGSAAAGAGALQLHGGLTVWSLTADLDGTLVLDPSGATPVPQGRLYLTDTATGTWRVDVTDDGALITSSAAPTADDVIYLSGGPIIATPDPTLGYELIVTPDGALRTIAAGVPHAGPSNRVGDGPPTGTARESSTYLDRLDGYVLYVYDRGAWRSATGGYGGTGFDSP